MDKAKKWIKKVEVEVNFHLSIRLQVPEVYLEPCQTLKMGLFAKIVINRFQALTFSQKLHLRYLTGFWIHLWTSNLHVSYTPDPFHDSVYMLSMFKGFSDIFSYNYISKKLI